MSTLTSSKPSPAWPLACDSAQGRRILAARRNDASSGSGPACKDLVDVGEREAAKTHGGRRRRRGRPQLLIDVLRRARISTPC